MSPGSGSGWTQGAQSAGAPGSRLPPPPPPPALRPVPLRAMLHPRVPAAAASLRAGRSWTSSDFGGRGREEAARDWGAVFWEQGAEAQRGRREDTARSWRGLRALGHRDPGPRRAACGHAWPRLRPRLPRGLRRRHLAADGRGGLAASPTRGCAPGRGTGNQGSVEARALAGPIAARASRRAPAGAQPWEENVMVTRVPATCRTSPTPRISCLRALALPGKALNYARGVWVLLVFVLSLPWGDSWGGGGGRPGGRIG